MKKELIPNQILFDLLRLVRIESIQVLNLLDYAELLIDIFASIEKIIGMQYTDIKWNENTEYEIIYQLFIILSSDNLDSNIMLMDIEDNKKALTAILLQIQSKKERKLLNPPKMVSFVQSQEYIAGRYQYKSPLIKQFDPMIHQKVLNEIAVKDSFAFFQKNESFPILSKINDGRCI